MGYATDNTEMLNSIERMLKAAARRVGDADEFDLEHLVKIRDLAEKAVVDAVRLQKESGKTWEEISLGLGTTRQGAFQKYSKRILKAA